MKDKKTQTRPCKTTIGITSTTAGKNAGITASEGVGSPVYATADTSGPAHGPADTSASEQCPAELHPLEPFLPTGATVLMLGSFPPQRIRWSMDFYYPNMQNDMWRIFGIVFFNSKDHFITERKFDEGRIRTFCTERGIALSDTARSVVRLNNNASDKFLEVTEPIDLAATLSFLPACRTIVTTGGKATDTLLPMIGAEEPQVGSYAPFSFAGRDMRLYRMPSSSRAYPKPLEEKAAVYARMFAEIGLV